MCAAYAVDSEITSEDLGAELRAVEELLEVGEVGGDVLRKGLLPVGSTIASAVVRLNEDTVDIAGLLNEHLAHGEVLVVVTQEVTLASNVAGDGVRLSNLARH